MKETNEQIDVPEIIKRVVQKKWTYALVLFSTFAVVYALVLPVPGYYKSGMSLIPELGNINKGGGLSDIAASIGFNLDSTMLPDAISPELCPELLKSNRFISQPIDIRVKGLDGVIDITYYNYLDKHQKPNPLTIPLYFPKNLFKKRTALTPQDHHINYFRLTMRECEVLSVIRDKVTCRVDKKTSLISIEIEDQDLLISATMAGSVRYKLQEFITEYQTSRACHDMSYYKGLTAKVKHTCEKARQACGSYVDANMGIMLESFKSKKDDLENDIQLRFSAYSTLNTQLQAAIAKAREKTLVFTVATSAAVSLKPADPKRMIFVVGMLFLASIVTTIYASRDLIF